MDKFFQTNGSEYIDKSIDEAIKNGTRTATISGNYEIDTAIKLPSDFTLILENCHLRLADGCYSNIFTNENHGTEIGKTPDEIYLRAGCHDIVIENITGFTEDDTIALTGLWGTMEKEYKVNDFSSDICNIKIKNINSSALCTNVRPLNQGDIKLHDILIDGVYDTSADCPYMDRGLYGVRVGDERLYGTRHSTCDETYNITIKNVRSRDNCAVTLSGATKNLILENTEAFDGAEELVDLRTEIK